jgi:hypothetical protein
MSLEKYNALEEKEDWPIEFGNKIGRLHWASLLTGRKMDFDDDYEDMCFSIHQANNQKKDKGLFSGFGKNHASDWKCQASNEIKGANRCTMKSAPPSTHYENYMFYFMDTEAENVYITITCFSNGDVGWISVARPFPMTENEQRAVQKVVNNLGFDEISTVPMHAQSCVNKS